MIKILRFAVSLFVCCLFLTIPAPSQTVGIVLSGGGARGCTHIGILKALEENEIPIDYVIGTSQGAIISAFYAMGYTVDEMRAVLGSEEFKEWTNLYLPDNKKYGFRYSDRTPEFVSVQIVKDDSIHFALKLPRSVVNPVYLNFGLMKMFAQGGAACNGNFDSLFVPFRCVASDIYEKKSVVHRSGNLTKCIRSSMSFPFIFPPTKIDGKLLVDGGVYDNFPIHRLASEFNPDIIIGSSVTSNISPLDESAGMYDLMECMITMKQDFSMPKDKKGHIFEFKYDDVNLLDFDRMDELIQIGYDSCMAHIDEIKELVARRKTQAEVDSARAVFKAKTPPLVFKNIRIPGLKQSKRSFIESILWRKKDSLTIDEFKDSYFKLLSDRHVQEIEPQAIYRDGCYELELDVKMKSLLNLSIGGNISSLLLNQLYFGIEYLGVYHLPYDFYLRGQIGNYFTSLQLGARTDLSSKQPQYFKLIGGIQNYKYHGKYSFFNYDKQTLSSTYETFVKLKYGFPFFSHGRVEIGTGYGLLKHNYPTTIDYNNKRDITRRKLWVTSVGLKNNTMQHRQYPVDGSYTNISANLVMGREQLTEYRRDDNNELYKTVSDLDRGVKFQVSAHHSQYWKLAKHFVLGATGELCVSNWNYDGNDYSTYFRLPSFAPTLYSMTSMIERYRAPAFAAIGIKPIIKINNQLHFRYESYLFGKMDLLGRCPIVKRDFSMINELTFVVQLDMLTAGVFVGTYKFPFKDFVAGLNIGFLIFGEGLLEK